MWGRARDLVRGERESAFARKMSHLDRSIPLMVFALMLAIALALLAAFAVGSSRPERIDRSLPEDADVEELVMLDIASDGELDGDFDREGEDRV